MRFPTAAIDTLADAAGPGRIFAADLADTVRVSRVSASGHSYAVSADVDGGSAGLAVNTVSPGSDAFEGRCVRPGTGVDIPFGPVGDTADIRDRRVAALVERLFRAVKVSARTA